MLSSEDDNGEEIKMAWVENISNQTIMYEENTSYPHFDVSWNAFRSSLCSLKVLSILVGKCDRISQWPPAPSIESCFSIFTDSGYILKRLQFFHSNSENEEYETAHLNKIRTFKLIDFPYQLIWGTRYRSWLRHCATSLEGCGFDSRWGHWGFFNWRNPRAALWP
jgi:hypothetical protein